MENLILSGQFKPPAPYSLGGHFDQVTNNKGTEQHFRNTGNVFRLGVDDLFRVISLRPDPLERAALLDVLETRLRSFGESRKYLEAPSQPSKPPGEVMTNFFIENVLGLSGDTAEQKAASEIRGLLRKALELGLNDRGKSQLKFLKWASDVVDAKPGDPRFRAVLAGAGEQLTKLLVKYQPMILKAMVRRGPIPAIVVDRFRKLIALRLAWRVTFAVRFAWVSPVLLALDLLLTPSEIESDEKMLFLGLYSKVCEDRRLIYSTIFDRCDQTEWKYKMEPISALRAAIQAG
ncbi:MAG: hypothetical protein JWN21_1148 [Sphingomonas bacterium]|uniref:hypothetical protein n=1 Tax=Sphingomonas bacterium TaxID=1895847 RepID=UPI0026202C0D|nr:hypothetical protein [Sphingomonas bacterium]MDB5695605.1 hypothetical protein [Sphingomonas bacterium]